VTSTEGGTGGSSTGDGGIGNSSTGDGGTSTGGSDGTSDGCSPQEPLPDEDGLYGDCLDLELLVPSAVEYETHNVQHPYTDWPNDEITCPHLDGPGHLLIEDADTWADFREVCLVDLPDQDFSTTRVAVVENYMSESCPDELESLVVMENCNMLHVDASFRYLEPHDCAWSCDAYGHDLTILIIQSAQDTTICSHLPPCE
jgi:hypothetical protein